MCIASGVLNQQAVCARVQQHVAADALGAKARHMRTRVCARVTNKIMPHLLHLLTAAVASGVLNKHAVCARVQQQHVAADALQAGLRGGDVRIEIILAACARVRIELL